MSKFTIKDITSSSFEVYHSENLYHGVEIYTFGYGYVNLYFQKDNGDTLDRRYFTSVVIEGHCSYEELGDRLVEEVLDNIDPDTLQYYPKTIHSVLEEQCVVRFIGSSPYHPVERIKKSGKAICTHIMAHYPDINPNGLFEISGKCITGDFIISGIKDHPLMEKIASIPDGFFDFNWPIDVDLKIYTG